MDSLLDDLSDGDACDFDEDFDVDALLDGVDEDNGDDATENVDDEVLDYEEDALLDDDDEEEVGESEENEATPSPVKEVPAPAPSNGKPTIAPKVSTAPRTIPAVPSSTARFSASYSNSRPMIKPIQAVPSRSNIRPTPPALGYNPTVPPPRVVPIHLPPPKLPSNVTAMSLASMAASTSADYWDSAIEQFLKKTTMPREDRRSERRRSRSPPRERRKESRRSREKSEERRAEELEWRRQAKKLGLDADDYIKRLRQQQRLREMKLREKRRKRLADAGRLPPEKDPSSVNPAYLPLHPQIKVAESKRLACVPKSSTSSSAPPAVSKVVQNHAVIMRSIETNKPMVAIDTRPEKVTIAPRATIVRTAPAPVACRLKPPPSMQPAVKRDGVKITVARNDNGNVPRRAVVAESATGNQGVLRRVVMPTAVTTTSTTSTVKSGKRVVTMDPDLPPVVAKKPVLPDRLADRLSGPKSASMTITKSIAPPKEEPKAPATVNVKPPQPSAPVIRHIRRAVETPVVSAQPVVQATGEAVAPPPATTGLKAHVAAVVTNMSATTPAMKLKIIAGTIGKVKLCTSTSPTSVSIVFEDSADTSSFVQQYNGQTMGGNKICVALNTFYES